MRALVSVLMLAGFYLVAIALVVGAGAAGLWLASVTTGLIAVKIVLPVILATVGGVGAALWRTLRTKPTPPEGLLVLPDQARDLWATVHELAQEAGTRMPDEIRLVPEVNAAVSEDAKFLGLAGGRRYLYIGIPLLQAMSVSQLRAVLAHELGHYSGSHTRLGAIAYRGRLTIGTTLSRIGRYNVAGLVFKGYARLYLLVDNAVSRRQEYEADLASVRVAGREAAASALRELPVLGSAWSFYFRNYVEPGWETGYAPADLFGGFAELVHARHHELAALRQRPPAGQKSLWDTHPPIPDRIAAIAAAPERAALPDNRPAGVLLANLTEAGQRMQQLMVEVGERTVLDWPQFTHAMMSALMQRRGDRVLRETVRRTGVTNASLATLLDQVAAGRLPEIAAVFHPDLPADEACQRFAEAVEVLMWVAAVNSGVAYWQHSWSGPAEFLDRAGQPLVLERVAQLATHPATLNEAHHQLAVLGIDPTRAVLVEQTATATGAQVIAALANIKVNNVDHDLYVLSNGLVVVPDPGKVDGAEGRLAQVARSTSADQLAKENHFLPYEEIATVEIQRNTPVKLALSLHNGTRVEFKERWDGEQLTKRCREVLLEVMGQVGR